MWICFWTGKEWILESIIEVEKFDKAGTSQNSLRVVDFNETKSSKNIMESDRKSIGILKWDEKSETCSRYLAWTKALAEYYDCRDVIDIVKIDECSSNT